MSKQNGANIPDYSSFHREINDTSSPVHHNNDDDDNKEEKNNLNQSSSSSSSASSKKAIPQFETTIPDKTKLNSYASTDEDVDEVNLDYPEDINQSTQIYRDRLNARVNNPEPTFTRSRIFSTEFSQTHDSGVDILSEQKQSQIKIDVQSSEQTTNQNLSDDSLLDTEPPVLIQSDEPTFKIPMNKTDKSVSLSDESDYAKNYLTARSDQQKQPTNTSEQYYSAESEFNTSITLPTNEQLSSYELEDIQDEDVDEQIPSQTTILPNSTSTTENQGEAPTFGDWIDQVFTTFLAETNQQSSSTSTSRSSSIVSIHTSQNTLDTLSSPTLTVIENSQKTNQNLTIISKTPIVFDETNSQHRRSSSWPNSEQNIEAITSDTNFNNEITSQTNRNSPSNQFNHENTNRRLSASSTSSSSSSSSNNDEEVINKATIDNNEQKSMNSPENLELMHFDDDESHDNATNNEAEHVNNDKYAEIDNKPLVQIAMSDDSSNFDKFLFREPQSNQHTNSHDSLLQVDYDHHHRDPINTATSSTDDLSTMNHLSASVFHSKDSALGLSDDNLNIPQTNQFQTTDDDDEQEQRLSSQTTEDNLIVENNTTVNNLDQNELTYDHSNNNSMISIDKQQNLLSPTFQTGHNERTISSSSSEQLIPREKQTGMYYPAFGSPASVRLAEKYNCEWLQDVTTPPALQRTSTSIEDNESLTNSRVFQQNHSIGDDDEFVLTFRHHLQPTYSCPDLYSSVQREPLRERSYSLTTLDAYARLNITRDTLEQMWLSLLDLAFSDKDDRELGERKLHHIMSLSDSYSNINNSVIEKSRSHGDIFSSTNRTGKLNTKKSKSFDITSLPKPSARDDSANVGLLQGAAISEPFVDRIDIESNHSDTEPNLIDMDNESVKSLTHENPPFSPPYSPTPTSQPMTSELPEEQTSTIAKSTSIVHEPLDYVFRYPHQLMRNDDDDDYFEQIPDISNYLPQPMPTMNEKFGEEDRQLYMALGFDDDDDDEAPAAFPPVIDQRPAHEKLAEYRPHSLSTIPSSRASQYASSEADSDEIIDLNDNLRRNTISDNQEDLSQSDHSEKQDEDDDDGDDSESVHSEKLEVDDTQSIHSEKQDEQPKPEEITTYIDRRPVPDILADHRPHSLSTIRSSSASQYDETGDNDDDNDNDFDEYGYMRRATITNNQDDEQNSQSKNSIVYDIDSDAWEKSLSEHRNEQDIFSYTDQLTTAILKDTIEQTRKSPIAQIDQTPLIDLSTHDDLTEQMNVQNDVKSDESTHTSLSSIHDTHLDPNELAYRLARLGSADLSSPPKLTFADELAELGEKDSQFDNDSLDHTPAIQEQEINEELPIESEQSTPHTYGSTSPPSPDALKIDELTSIAQDIRDINQEKSISSLCTIVEDIHAQTNNQNLTRIVDYHHSPPIANLQTIATELHQTPIGKSAPRPERPTHLELEQEQEQVEEEIEEQTIQSPLIIDTVPFSSNIVSNLEDQLAAYKIQTPSPPPPVPVKRRTSEQSYLSSAARYQTQRIDKVSDLEIVKQGKGFKIGYVDRQGTDQRVILTKRIEAGPDIMARDPHVRLPYKGRKILTQVHNAVLHTNGYNALQEDKKYEQVFDDIEIPIIGTNPQHFDESDMISIDIDGPSTMLNSICESIVITQGSVYSINSPRSSTESRTVSQPIVKSTFDHNLSPLSSSHHRHVVIDQHDEYLLETTPTATPTKKDKIEVIDTWKDRTVIDGSGTTWRSPSLQSHKATKHIQPSMTAQNYSPPVQPQTIQSRFVPAYDTNYRTSEQQNVPSVFDWNEDNSDTPRKFSKTTRDIALSPILIEQKQPSIDISKPEKVDRSCQYSPPAQLDRSLQCQFENLTTSTQVSSYEIPNFMITHDGTQTINEINPPFDDSGIQTQVPTYSPALSIASSDHHQPSQPFVLSGSDFIRKLNEQRAHASALTVTQYTDGNYYIPSTDNHQSANSTTVRPTTLERSADSGILVDEQSSRIRPTKAHFALQVDIKGSSSDSEDVSELTQQSVHRSKPSAKDELYEHHSELSISPRKLLASQSRQHSSSNDKRYEQPRTSSPKEIEQQISQLRRERAHILDLLSLNWNRSNIWVELTEAKLNYIIGETDALLRSLSFDGSPTDSERVKSKVQQYEQEMAELTRQRLAIYRERLEDSKRQIDMRIDELESKKSSVHHPPSHYSTLEYTPRSKHSRHSKTFLSTSAENLSNIPLQETISTHPHLLDVSFLATSNQNIPLPPRYPRSPRYPHQHPSNDVYRNIHRPTPRYASVANDTRYDYPQYRPTGNLSDMQGLSKSQQAIIDETDKLVKDSQQFHHESASQFERARESLLSSETSIRLARANMSATRHSPNPTYLSTEVTLADLFKYEQSLAKETARNTRTYTSLSTSTES